MTSVANSATANAAAAQPVAPASASGPSLWSHGNFSFKDLVDIVNPLQHLPVIGSVYRYLTGDEPSGGARIIGDSLYGGPIGFGVSVVSTALLNDSSGHDIGERVLADVFGPRDGSTPTATAVAATPSAAMGTSAAQAAPMNANPTTQQTGLIQPPSPAQPVAMNQLFRSPSAANSAAPTTPQQTFLAQNAQFQRQITAGRGTNGAVLNGRQVPLELSGNLLPMLPPGARMVAPGSATAAAVTAAQAAPTASSPTPATPAATVPTPAAAFSGPAQASALPSPSPGNPNPLAQKMLDALNKYEQLKKEQAQEDSADQNAPSQAPSKVDLSL